MAANNQDIDTQGRWKSRYYEALGEIEERERLWRETERLLRHLVTRLTLAADTRHQSLNQSLGELRNAIRDGRDILRLQELIEYISEQVAELDNIRNRSRNSTHPATILSDILARLQLAQVNSRDIRQLKKQIEQLQPEDEAEEIYDQFAALVNSSLAMEDEHVPAKTRRQKLLDRILLRQEKIAEEMSAEAAENSGKAHSNQDGEGPATPQKLMAPAVGDLLLQLALRMPDAVKRRMNFQALKKHTNRARQRKDLIAIIDVIAQHVEAAYMQEKPVMVVLDDDSVASMSQAMAEVLQQINPPLDLRERLGELEVYFNEHGDDVEGLIHSLHRLADIVAEICNRLAFQREELEGFFMQLSMRLEDLDLGLRQTSGIYNEVHQQNVHMEKAVQDELQEIHISMQTAGDIAKLKEVIQIRLDTIDQHLLRFHDEEKQRYEQAQQMITELGKKVSELEMDSKQLQSRLEETQQQALRDVLTGIANRQAYEERLASEIARSKRYGTTLSMVVWDVDKFKEINDNYGHSGGDRVLKVLADMLSSCVRETDFVARYGGEEFVMLMPETNADSAMQVANKLRQEIEQTPFHFHDARVLVTMSAGVAQYHPDELITSLFERADAALYAAKEAGRNQVHNAER